MCVCVGITERERTLLRHNVYDRVSRRAMILGIGDPCMYMNAHRVQLLLLSCKSWIYSKCFSFSKLKLSFSVSIMQRVQNVKLWDKICIRRKTQQTPSVFASFSQTPLPPTKDRRAVRFCDYLDWYCDCDMNCDIRNYRKKLEIRNYNFLNPYTHFHWERNSNH